MRARLGIDDDLFHHSEAQKSQQVHAPGTGDDVFLIRKLRTVGGCTPRELADDLSHHPENQKGRRAQTAGAANDSSADGKRRSLSERTRREPPMTFPLRGNSEALAGACRSGAGLNDSVQNRENAPQRARAVREPPGALAESMERLGRSYFSAASRCASATALRSEAGRTTSTCAPCLKISIKISWG